MSKERFEVLDRELDERFFDGIRKILFWIPGTNETYVNVTDERTGLHFTVPVGEGENPLHVLDHACAQSPFDMQRNNIYAAPDGEV